MANSSDVKIVVLGVGGGGNNAVNNMVLESEGNQIKFVVVNTDAQDLEKSKATNKILISTKNKKNEGLGAGAKPEVGTDAAENCIDKIKAELEGADICFIAAGLGGGTGSGAAHVIARCAKEVMDITTVAVVTRPFQWEGRKRALNAQEALENLNAATDALIEIPNDKVVDMADKKTSLSDAFKAADNVLKDGVLGITDLITKTGLINLDFADVQAIVKDAGISHMGIGTYKATGEEENTVLKALSRAIESPLLETNINGARRIMINYVSSEELTMLDISEANQMVYDMVDDDVNLIWGTANDATLPEGEVKVTVIAAEFNNECLNHNPMTVNNQRVVQPQAQQMSSAASNMSNMIGNVGANNFQSTGFGAMNTQPAQPVQPTQPVQQNSNNFGNAPRDFDTSRFKSLFARK